MNKNFTKLMCVTTAIAAALTFSTTAYASSTSDAKEAIDTNKKCSVAITYASQGTEFEDVDIKLYQIADVSDDFIYTPCKDFSGYSVNLNNVLSVTEWKQLTTTLNGYIIADNIKPTKTVATNKNGVAEFSELNCGMYLVSETKIEKDENTYTFESFMISLPNLNENGKWDYEVKSNPKSDKIHNEPEKPAKNKKEYTVVKTWKDSANSINRPDSVTIELFKDGVSQGTQILNNKNNWSYSWESINDNADWTVVERDVPTGYTVNVSQNGNTFTVVNTYPGNPDNPKTGDNSQMELYMLLMFISGTALIIIGIICKKKLTKSK